VSGRAEVRQSSGSLRPALLSGQRDNQDSETIRPADPSRQKVGQASG
jgi:hypothetical protein